MKSLISIIAFFAFSFAYCQNDDCIKHGQLLSTKTDSLLNVGWNHATKPTIKIIEYAKLPVRSALNTQPGEKDTTRFINTNVDSRVYYMNNQTVKVEFTAYQSEQLDTIIKETKTLINVFYESNQPNYINYKLETWIDGARKLIISYDICYDDFERNLKLSINNADDIIKTINQIINDGSR